MSKGGTSSVEIPAWLENAAIENINRARDVQKIGYTPYYGPDVAAMTPMQEQAMRATGSAAQAFGLAGADFDPMAGMPTASEFTGGVRGYSSAPLFEEAVGTLRQVRPGQALATEGMFIDPYSGQYVPGAYAPTAEQISQTGYVERDQQRAHELAVAQAQAAQDQSTNINVTGGSMVMDQGPITVQTEQGPVTVDPTMGFNPVFSPDAGQQYIEVDPSMTYNPSFDPAFDPTYAPTGTVTYGEPDATVYDLDGNVVEEVFYGANAQDLNIDPNIGLTGDWPAAGTVSYADPVSQIGNVTYAPMGTTNATGLDLSATMSAPENMVQMQFVDPLTSGAQSAGMTQDVGLMDLLGTAMSTSPLNLGSALLTGSILNPNTAPIPVVDQSTATADLPPVVTTTPSNDSGGSDMVTALASQGPTGTYNQAYWAEKLASGATQAELKEEMDEIASAGGKVYTGSTPQTNTTTSSSTGGKG